ncbi:MAG: hypothetical protein WC869_05150 [Phycisphaerae bacterium]|jgi:hypothetical protein
MTITFTTDNIDSFDARAVGRGLWEVTFASANAGLHHQLYADGELLAASDTPSQRRFLLDGRCRGRRVTIAAIDGENRWTDMSASLSAEAFARPGWVFAATVVRGIEHARGDRVALLDDHATGTIDPAPLAIAEYWPDGTPRWAWGEDHFGLGGMGFDGTLAPGLRDGAFGAGQFGLDAETFVVSHALAEAGAHQLRLRTLTRDGGHCDGPVITFVSAPPLPVATLEALAYNNATGTLTLSLT